MKPLPFDMTPLARSLSMPTVPRRALADADSSMEGSAIAPSVGVTTEPVSAPANVAVVAAATETAILDPAPTLPDAELPAMELPKENVSEPILEALPVVEVEPDAIAMESAEDAQVDAPVEEIEESTPELAPVVEKVADTTTVETKVDALPESLVTEATAAIVETVEQPATTEVGSPRTELRTATYPLHLKMHEGWTSQLAQEQIHALAIHILARHAENKLRTLAITSALAGEGKTTISLALAEKLSQTGKRILIIDLDAHRATLSRDAKLDDAAGAMQSSDPRDPSNLDFHVYPTDIPGISIMPAGYPEAGLDGPPLISPVHIGVLVLRAIEEYDLVILDCPPLLPVADTHVIGEVADSALLVVRAGSTPRAIVDEAIDEFGRGKFLGAVLNRALPADIPYFREVYGYYRRYSTHE